jgi:hypothetical protein
LPLPVQPCSFFGGLADNIDDQSGNERSQIDEHGEVENPADGQRHFLPFLINLQTITSAKV